MVGPFKEKKIVGIGSSSLILSLKKRVQSLYSYLLKFEEYTIGLVLMIMVISIFLQVVYRYILRQSITGSEELGRYLMVLLTFIGAGLGIEKDTHIKVRILGTFVQSGNVSKLIGIVVNLCGIVFCFIFTYLCYQLFKDVTQFGHRSPAMNIPMFFPIGGMLIGSILMTFHFTINFLKKIFNFKRD